MRSYSLLDKIIIEIDRAASTINNNVVSTRPMPTTTNVKLKQHDSKKSVALMRVNHVGEVCAQALYYGQSLTTKDKKIKSFLINSAMEEEDHLSWCQIRIDQLNGRVSYFNPFWYGASFMLGSFAGLLDKEWSLGFVKATEEQVEQHLKSHLDLLPLSDNASRAIVHQMIEDEASHANHAVILGARDLPPIVQSVMQGVAKVMTTVAYWL